ncbi:hypothetical protein [Streptomyces sp. NPDC058155]|uniref:hypothetical protein n=1 Tax=Streptomyces sp. NPDC058155 TaxID=3346359 RepID=UPI0036E39E92
MTPPQAKTWSQRGRTPVVRVRGRSRRRVSIAALTCYKPGHRLRLIYRPRRDDGRRDGRKSFSWRDYRDLLTAAHQQLGGPIVLIWDNLNVHKAADHHTSFPLPECSSAKSPSENNSPDSSRIRIVRLPFGNAARGTRASVPRQPVNLPGPQ